MAVLLASCGPAPRPLVTIWPSSYDPGVLPLTGATKGASVSDVGGKLLVDLKEGGDFVVSRGAHAIPAHANPVLRLTVAPDGPALTMLHVWVMPTGSSLEHTTPFTVHVAPVRAGEPREIVVPLGPGLRGGELDLVGLAAGASGGRFVVDRMDLASADAGLRLRAMLQTSLLRGLPATYLVLLAALSCVAVLLLGRLALRLLPTPLRVEDQAVATRVVLGGIAAAWAAFGAAALLHGLQAVWSDSAYYAGHSQGDRRKLGQGASMYALTELVDAHVPPSQGIAILPRRKGLNGWKIGMSVAPRRIWVYPCGASPSELPDDVFVAAEPGCLEAGPGSGIETVETDRFGNILGRRGNPATAPLRPLLPAEEAPAGALEVPRLLAGLLLLLLLGEAALRIFFRGGAGPSGSERLALCWLLGAGIVTMLVFVATRAGLPPWTTALALTLGIVAAGLRLGRALPAGESRPPLAPDEKVSAGVATGAFLVVLWGAFAVPIHEWDELINWGYRGHVYYHVGPTRQAVADYAATSPRHKAYPPGVPLLQAVTGRVAGRWDDARSKASAALYFGAMVLLVTAAIGRRRLALFYAALAASGPMALLMGTLGMADLPLGPLLLAALLCIERYTVHADSRGWLALAGFLGALLSWVKLDGGALKLLLLGVAVLVVGRTRGAPIRRRLVDLGLMALLAFAPIAPWWQLYRSLDLTDWVVRDATPTSIGSKLHLADDIAARLPHYLFHARWEHEGGPHFGLVYVMLLATCGLALRTMLGARCRWLTVALAFGILGYASIYLVSPQGVYQMERSLDRILLHFYPLAVALAGRAHAAVLDAVHRR